jgi:hypothetical protein
LVASSSDTLADYVKLHKKGAEAHIAKLQEYRFLSKLLQIQEAMKKRKPVQEAFSEAFSEYKDGINALGKGIQSKELKTEIEKMREKERIINDLKMDALYVDVINNTVTSPFDSKYKELAAKNLIALEQLTAFVVNVLFKLELQKP